MILADNVENREGLRFSVDVAETQNGKQCQRKILVVHLRRGATLNGL
jgi:hypothetical protein